jgi:hypothetical protein
MSITLYSNVKPKQVIEKALESSQDVCGKTNLTFDSKFLLWVDVIYVRLIVFLHVFNFLFVHVRSFFLDRICFLHHASLVSGQFAWTELSFVLVGQSVVQVYCFF